MCFKNKYCKIILPFLSLKFLIKEIILKHTYFKPISKQIQNLPELGFLCRLFNIFMYFMYVYFRGSKNSYMAALVCGCSFITMILIYIPSTHRVIPFGSCYGCIVFFCLFLWGGVYSCCVNSFCLLSQSSVILLLSIRIASAFSRYSRVY